MYADWWEKDEKNSFNIVVAQSQANEEDSEYATIVERKLVKHKVWGC